MLMGSGGVQTTVQPLLSVCIPTFNRAALLEVTLLGLEEQMAHPGVDGSLLEIVIVDNHSPDRTPTVVEAFARRNPHGVRARRHSHNTGADNVYRCTEHATGKFVWILSDDDVLLPGALAQIFAVLQARGSIDALSVNLVGLQEDGTAGPAVFKRNLYVESVEAPALFVELGAMLTFLSSVVYRRSLVADRDYSFTHGTNLIQAYAFVDALLAGGEVCRLRDPSIAYRSNNSGAFDYFRVYVDNFAALLMYARENGLPPNAADTVLRQHLSRHILPFLLSVRLNGSFGEVKVRWAAGRLALLRHFPKHDPFLIAALLVTVAPRTPLVLVSRVRRAIRSAKGLYLRKTA